MMRKLLLLFTVLTFGVGMSSCLKMGSQHFSESDVISYIVTQEGGLGFEKYARTTTARYITSASEKANGIQSMNSGTFQLMSYQWDEKEDGYIAIGGSSLPNVNIVGETKAIQQAQLGYGQPQSDGVAFENMTYSFHLPTGGWFDDYTLLNYTYKAKEGQTPYVEAFLRNNSDTEEDPNKPQTLVIDIRLSLRGEALEGDAEVKTRKDYVAVNLKDIRSRFLTEEKNKMSIKFNYMESPNDEKDEPKEKALSPNAELHYVKTDYN